MDETHRDRAGELAKWLNAYADGAEIEYTYINKWYKVNKNHTWDVCAQYRIAVTKDSINWDHVAPEFNAIFRQPDGTSCLSQRAPTRGEEGFWDHGRITSPISYASYRRGTSDWKDSLVERPK